MAVDLVVCKGDLPLNLGKDGMVPAHANRPIVSEVVLGSSLANDDIARGGVVSTAHTQHTHMFTCHMQHTDMGGRKLPA